MRPINSASHRLAFVVRLLALGLAAALAGRGAGYAGPTAPGAPPPGLAPLDALLPLHVWGTLCFAVAAALSLALLTRGAWSAALIAYLALHGAWAASHLVSTWADAPRGWLTAVGYLPEIVAALSLLIIGPPRPLIGRRLPR